MLGGLPDASNARGVSSPLSSRDRSIGVPRVSRARKADYRAVMDPEFTRLEDYRVRRMNMRVECGNCGHAGVLDGEKLWRWFVLHRWKSSLDQIGDHMRCSVCQRRPTGFTPTSDPPTRDFGPSDELGWKAVVRRLRAG
ncbi:hypothetical protein [Sphingomonas oryzagri]